MTQPNRTTIYLEPHVYRALKLKAAETDRGLSELVNEAVLLSLREDEADLAAVRKRRHERGRPFEDFLRELKRDGRI